MKTKNFKDLKRVDKIDVISGPKYCPGMNFRLITFLISIFNVFHAESEGQLVLNLLNF